MVSVDYSVSIVMFAQTYKVHAKAALHPPPPPPPPITSPQEMKYEIQDIMSIV